MTPGTEACASWGAEALQRAVHGDGEVAAAELVGVAWRGEERSSARGSGSRGSLGCRVGRWGSRSWPGPPRRRAALNCAGGREAEREGGGRRRVDLFANSENSKDPTVNQQ